jgi:predicted Zn finger-like uncharacterized protein
MHVTCPSCKFGGTVRDDQIPPGGKEVYCPNCNTKFRIRKDQSLPSASQKIREKGTVAKADRSEYLTISCPICGFEGKVKRSALVTAQSRKFACPSCKNIFTFSKADADLASREDPASAAVPVETDSSCPGCGSKISHTLPVCPSCGTVLTGVRIYCPSCKSTNVGINNTTHDNARPTWETMVFRPVSAAAGQADIRIPLSCRDCGNTWTIQPGLIQPPENT